MSMESPSPVKARPTNFKKVFGDDDSVA